MSSSTLSSFPKKFTRRSIITSLTVGIPGSIWASVLEPKLLTITRKELTLPQWPKALDGFRVAQLTDLHYHPKYDIALMDETIAALKKENPDLVALTGDFVNRDDTGLQVFKRYFAQLSAPQGIYVIPGNHDVWHCSAGRLRKSVEKAGLSYLENDGTTLHIKGERIFITGLDSVWGGCFDSARAWKGHQKQDPVITLAHEPDTFDELRLTRPVSLQLSGHTHGGQCRIPFVSYTLATVKYGKKYIYGAFEKNDSQLWVSRGLGTGSLRIRFACPPELAILTLRSR